MIELNMNDTDEFVNIIMQLREKGTHFYAYLDSQKQKWRIELLPS